MTLSLPTDADNPDRPAPEVLQSMDAAIRTAQLFDPGFLFSQPDIQSELPGITAERALFYISTIPYGEPNGILCVVAVDQRPQGRTDQFAVLMGKDLSPERQVQLADIYHRHLHSVQ